MRGGRAGAAGGRRAAAVGSAAWAWGGREVARGAPTPPSLGLSSPPAPAPYLSPHPTNHNSCTVKFGDDGRFVEVLMRSQAEQHALLNEALGQDEE